MGLPPYATKTVCYFVAMPNDSRDDVRYSMQLAYRTVQSPALLDLIMAAIIVLRAIIRVTCSSVLSSSELVRTNATAAI